MENSHSWVLWSGAQFISFCATFNLSLTCSDFGCYPTAPTTQREEQSKDCLKVDCEIITWIPIQDKKQFRYQNTIACDAEPYGPLSVILFGMWDFMVSKLLFNFSYFLPCHRIITFNWYCHNRLKEILFNIRKLKFETETTSYVWFSLLTDPMND